MCGIFGIIKHHKTSLSATERQRLLLFFNTLAVTAASRGTDATGISAINRKGFVALYKDVVPSYSMLVRQRWQEIVELVGAEQTFCVLGHTRNGTVGSNKQENAHPFLFSYNGIPIVGMHNGTISNHKEFGPTEKYSVDSANFLHSLALEKYVNWGPLLNKASGSFAVALGSGTRVALVRNGGSPCYVAYLSDLRITVFASTVHMLQSAQALSGLRMGKIRLLRERRIAVFRQGTRRPWSHCYEPEPKETESKPKETGAVTKTQTDDSMLWMCTTCHQMTNMVTERLAPGIVAMLCKTCHNPVCTVNKPRALLTAKT